LKLIQTITVGSGGAANVTFSSVPQTFTDLVFTVSARSTSSDFLDSIFISINGGAEGNVFTQVWAKGEGGGASADQYATPISLNYPFYNSAATTTANTFGSGLIYLPNYTVAASRSFIFDGGTENNSTTLYRMDLGGGRFNSTATISQIALGFANGNLVENSTISMYGITKGSDGIVTAS
jgi:hypothetical protein